MIRHTDDKLFWTFADLFREGRPGWRPSGVAFRREATTFRAAGSRWEIDVSVHGDADSAEIAVMEEQDGKYASRGLSARQRLDLFKFLERLERRLWALHFGGTFHIDHHDGIAASHFNKFAKSAASVRRNLDALEGLIATLTRRRGTQRQP